jgi:hypothetical protein
MTRLPALLGALLISAGLGGCAKQQVPTPVHQTLAPGSALAQPPAPAPSATPPDIFNVLVDGKMYNHMDDARRAMVEQDAKALTRVVPSDHPRFGTLLIVAPPVHVPALMVPNATADYRQRFGDFMTFLDSHGYETALAALRKSNDFSQVTLERAAPETGFNSPVNFRIWYQQDGGKETWWMEGPGRRGVKLTAKPGLSGYDNISAMIAELTSRAEQLK